FSGLLIKIENFYPVIASFMNGYCQLAAVRTEFHGANSRSEFVVSSYGAEHCLPDTFVAYWIKAEGVVPYFMKSHPSGVASAECSGVLRTWTEKKIIAAYNISHTLGIVPLNIY